MTECLGVFGWLLASHRPESSTPPSNWVHDRNASNRGGNGIITKGDNNKVHNNTCLDNPACGIRLPRNRLPFRSLPRAGVPALSLTRPARGAIMAARRGETDS